MGNTLKRELKNILLNAGAYDVRVANPAAGFEYADPERHPLKIMPECRSVVVFALATSPEMNNMYLGSYSPNKPGHRQLGPIPADCSSKTHTMYRLTSMFQEIFRYTAVTFLSERGFLYACGGIQLKVAAYESGMGTWGKAGFIMHPELGSRISLGTILTDAEMPADEKREQHFCDDCDTCHKICPAQAFGEGGHYHENWDRSACMKKRAEIAEKGFYCHNCFAGCLSTHIADNEILETKKAASWYKRGVE